MKKLILTVAATIMVVATSCHHEPGPQPMATIAPQSSNPVLSYDLTTDVGIANTLVGTWILDSSATYMNGSWYQSGSIPAGALNVFTNAKCNNSPIDSTKGCHTGNYSYCWQMSSVMYNQSGVHYIAGGTPTMSAYIKDITDSTIVTSGSSQNVMQGVYYYCHKQH